jgi:GT2 family glycosyltransferase
MSRDDQSRVAAVIPTHSRWEEAELCLRALVGSTYAGLEVVLVDDGSTDGTAEKCRRMLPQVQLLTGDGDLWWSGAVNLGVRHALGRGADYILLLNDDNRVDPETVERLVNCARATGPLTIACAQVRAVEEADYCVWAGGPPIWDTRPYSLVRNAFGLPDYVLTPHPPGGQGVLIPSACFRRIGLMDQGAFPQYYGDHDFYYRAMRAGYRMVVDLRAAVWSKISKTGVHDRQQPATVSWTVEYLFGRRSLMNLVVLARCMWRYCPRREMPALYLRQVWSALRRVAHAWHWRAALIYGGWRRSGNHSQ